MSSVVHCFFFFTAEYCSTFWMYHILFIHSPIDGHLDYFQLLAFMKMLLWTFAYMYLCGPMLSFLLGRFLKTEFLGCVLSVFNFWRNDHIVFQSVYTILYSYHHVRDLMSIYPHHICYFLFFDYGYSSRCEVVSCYGFSLHFLND